MPQNIDQQEKDNKNREVAADKAKPRCSICGKYTDKKTSPQCFGHGGGSGGSSNGGASGDKADKDDATTLTKSPSHIDKIETSNTMGSNIVLTPQLELNDIKFNPEIISELLSKRILVIDNDIEKGILAIKLQYDPNSLSQEQRYELKKFVNAILNELNKFKKEQGLSADYYKIEKDNNGNILSLHITLPTPKLYSEFIQRLANRYLLPIQNIEQQKNEKVIYPENRNHFNPTPFSTKPTPNNKKTKEEFENTVEKKSSRPKSLLDGLKPKGW